MGIHWYCGARYMNLSNLGRTMLLLGVGLVSGIALTILSMDESGWWQRELEPDTPLFETDIKEVRSFTYLTISKTLTAQRSKAGGPFAIQVTYADNRASQHCTSSPDLGGVLSSFARSKVKKQFNPKEIKSMYPASLGYIEVKDPVIGEPSAFWEIFTTNDHSVAVVVVERQAAAFEIISPGVFQKLEAGCGALAKH